MHQFLFSAIVKERKKKGRTIKSQIDKLLTSMAVCISKYFNEHLASQEDFKFIFTSSLLEFLLSHFFHKSHVHSLSVLFFICCLSPQQIWDLHYSPPLLPSFLFSACLCFNEVLLLRDLTASVGLQHEVFSDLLLKVSTQCILFGKSGVF